MLSIGLAVAGRFAGRSYDPADPITQVFYRELRPISDRFQPEALAVSRLDRDKLRTDGADPARVMCELAEWVRGVAGKATPVIVGFPVVYDWMFLYWYLIHFTGSSPFGHAGALDIKTIFQQRAQVAIDRAGLDDLPASVRPIQQHTHNAREDAIRQAEILNWLLASPVQAGNSAWTVN